MSGELQPPVLSVSLVKIELPTVVKDEPPEPEIVEIGMDDILDSSESKEEIIPDVKGIDIVYHPVCEGFIKSEILESYHCESVETQVLVNAKNSPFIKTENITQRNKTEDTSDENVTKGTGQAVVEVQASHEHSNALSKLDTDEQYVLNFSKNVNGISVSSRKSKSPEKTDFGECSKTGDTALWEKEKEKVKVIKATVIPVEAHEYTSLAKDSHVCNHCQYASNRLYTVKVHIKKMHRELTTMYQCPYCTYKSKWKGNHINEHIILKHKDTKDIQWFQCDLCAKKFKLKGVLTKHKKKVHLTHEQMQDGLELMRHHCDKIEYFYCYHCSYKSKEKWYLKRHIFTHHFKNAIQGKRYGCNECGYESYRNDNLQIHKLTHLKPEEIQYFYCYHCSYKCKWKGCLKIHIFRKHFKNFKQKKRYGCNNCDYKTYTSGKLKDHKLSHLKPEEIQYFYCYHCSCKIKRKADLKTHIFRHFKKEQVEFDCYICDFVTQKRYLIIEHIRKHFKNRNKYDETINKYQLESRIKNLKKKR